MSENFGLIKQNISDAFPHPLSDLGNLRESIFQRTNPGVDLGFGSAPLIFILVLICLILLLSIIVTLLCCLKAQISDNIQTATPSKTRSSRGIQTKLSRTEDIQPPKNVRIYFYLWEPKITTETIIMLCLKICKKWSFLYVINV